MSDFLNRLKSFVDSTPFNNTIMGLILINAVVIGMDTYPTMHSQYGSFLSTIDQIIIWIFVLEILLRWISWNPKVTFLANGWNLFDFIIITVALLPTAPYLSIIRIFRVLRVLRAFRFMPGMAKLVVALLKSIPSLGHILLLMLILFYVYGVIGTTLYSQAAPHLFGSLHMSVLTLFQVATLEGWPDILAVISQTSSGAWIYLLSFILMGTFVVLNLMVGVIVHNLQAAAKSHEENMVEKNGGPRKDLEDLKNALSRLERKLDQPTSPSDPSTSGQIRR